MRDLGISFLGISPTWTEGSCRTESSDELTEAYLDDVAEEGAFDTTILSDRTMPVVEFGTCLAKGSNGLLRVALERLLRPMDRYDKECDKVEMGGETDK